MRRFITASLALTIAATSVITGAVVVMAQDGSDLKIGLVTDVGSAVSHGAVVAREFGLPAVLNTREATRILKTGERVVLDGDRGTIERLDV